MYSNCTYLLEKLGTGTCFVSIFLTFTLPPHFRFFSFAIVIFRLVSYPYSDDDLDALLDDGDMEAAMAALRRKKAAAKAKKASKNKNKSGAKPGSGASKHSKTDIRSLLGNRRP